MGQRYRHNYQETGDIIDPTFFVLDNNELASEVNGSLDRDNFAEADIAQNEIVDEAFTDVTLYSSNTSYLPDILLTTWQGGKGNSADGIFLTGYIAGGATVTCLVDCVLDVNVALTWTWAGAGPSYTGTYPWNADAVELRLLIDGNEVCRAGPFEDVNDDYATFLMGQLVVTAGVHRVSVECLVAKRQYEGLDLIGPVTNQITFGQRRMIVIQEKR